jgi:hypothetical protein
MECSPEKVEGQVTAVDQNSGRVTIRDANGGTHEFQANKETVKDMKPATRSRRSFEKRRSAETVVSREVSRAIESLA